MPRTVVIALPIILLVVFVQIARPASPAVAAGTLDQSQEACIQIAPNGGNRSLGQTFTAGLTGSLDQVDLRLSRSGATGGVTVQIRSVVSGVPGPAILGSGTLTDSSIPASPASVAWVSVPMDTQASVSSGAMYSLVILSPAASSLNVCIAVLSGADFYGAGDLVVSLDGGATYDDADFTDLAFRTYVADASPPPPTPPAPPPAPPVQPPISDAQASQQGDETGKPRKLSEEQRQQRQNTNRGHRGDVTIEGNVTAVDPLPELNSLVVKIALTRNELQVVQIPCSGQDAAVTCPDIKIGDYLEADGYQNGVGDANDWFVAADNFEVTRGGKRIK